MREKHLSILGHLEDLRKAILYSIVSLVPTTAIGWIYKDWVLDVLTKPLREVNPDFKLLAFGPVAPVFTFMKLAAGIGVILALPIILYQFWNFILPALKQSERKVLGILVPASVLLFLAGVSFGYFTVFQIAVKYLWAFAVGTGNITPSYSLQDYLSFAIGFLLGFGAVFELPIVILTLAKFGIVTPKFLAKNRKYAILIITVVAAFLTPGPDIISQVLMAAPMYILYEVSIWLSYLVRRKPRAKEPEEDYLTGQQSAQEVAGELSKGQTDGDDPSADGQRVEEITDLNQEPAIEGETVQPEEIDYDEDGNTRLVKILDDIEKAGQAKEQGTRD